MLLVFWIVFSVPVISRIESIWMGGWGGGWEAEGGPKQPFGLNASSSVVPSAWDTDW